MGIARDCRLLAGSTVVALTALGCGDGPTPPVVPSVASVAVTSAVDTLLASGRTAQLTAAARDQAGHPVSAQFTWLSSNPAAVTVNASGLVTAQGTGTATITATAGSVSGTIRLRVVAADLATVGALGGDAFGGTLVGALTSAKRPPVQAAWGSCATGAGGGNIVAIVKCVADVRAEAASASDPTDRALVAVLVLFVNRIESLLGL